MEPDELLRSLPQNTPSSEYVTCRLEGTDSNEPDHDVNKVCRVCLHFGDVPIFDSDPSLNKSEDIKTIADVEVDNEDDLPKYICQSCVKLLEGAVLFRRTAKKSDKQLRSTHNYYGYTDNEYEPLASLKLEVGIHCDDSIDSIKVAEIESTHIKEECIAEPFVDTNISCVDTSLKESNKNAVANPELQVVEIAVDSLLVQNKHNCKICDMDFESGKAYSRHKKSVKHKKSIQSNKIECTVCFKKISNSFYNRHVESHSRDNKDEKLQCPFCNKAYSKTYFNHHLTTHNDHKKAPERIECSICNKSYEKQYYKFHLAIHDDASSKYVCDTCGKSFIQQSAFKRHSLIHGSELAYKCTLCPYRGRHPGLLKTHMHTHTRDYQHRCMECPARFLTKSNLNKHLQRHKGPVDFKCDMCKRGFYSKLELDRHFEADHLGVKKHMCNICGKAFGYRNAMMSHQLKVHKREKLTNGKGRLPLYLEADRTK